MLLVVRTLLIILFTINTAGSIAVNLLTISLVSVTVLQANFNGAHKKQPHNFLESFFSLQLVVFSVALLYIKIRSNGGASITAVMDSTPHLVFMVFKDVSTSQNIGGGGEHEDLGQK